MAIDSEVRRAWGGRLTRLGSPSRSSLAERLAFAGGSGVAAFNRFASSNLQPDRYERWKPVAFPLEVPTLIEFWRRSSSSFRFVSEAPLRR
jgi:hypothetical protein